ncbi:MAG: mechanosensitive ion channel family protein [Thermoplasmata archaeon]|nr:mechanosensitive ion channel family protein [Thermoplasmata archaeon]
MTDYPLIEKIVVSIAILVVSGLFFEALSRLMRTLVKRAGATTIAVAGIRDGLRILWVIVAGWGILAVWSIASELTFLTISGIAGLIISLSLQAVFSNMIAGLLLFQDGALRVGDRIEYSGVKGEVIRVALRNTWVRTEAGPIAVIGNSALTNGPLINHSAVARMTAHLSGE